VKHRARQFDKIFNSLKFRLKKCHRDGGDAGYEANASLLPVVDQKRWRRRRGKIRKDGLLIRMKDMLQSWRREQKTVMGRAG
jgi:IS4 transposase